MTAPSALLRGRQSCRSSVPVGGACCCVSGAAWWCRAEMQQQAPALLELCTDEAAAFKLRHTGLQAFVWRSLKRNKCNYASVFNSQRVIMALRQQLLWGSLILYGKKKPLRCVVKVKILKIITGLLTMKTRLKREPLFDLANNQHEPLLLALVCCGEY